MYPTSPSSKSMVRAVEPAAQATGLQSNDRGRNRRPRGNFRIDALYFAAAGDLRRLHRARLIAGRLRHIEVFRELHTSSIHSGLFPMYPASSHIRIGRISVWRNSSGAPKQAIARQALSRPKRAPRRLPMVPVNSARGKAAACTFPACRRRRAPRRLLVLYVIAVGRLESFFQVSPACVRKPGMSADHLGEDFLFGRIGKTEQLFPAACELQ
jgi:hypothetical protein